jgi:Phosphoinositide phospholipase C, Ca2+-dependent
MRTILLVSILCCGSIAQAADESLRITDLVSIGTHNSYKKAIPEAEMKLLRQRRPDVAEMLDYAHPPLAQQLDAGARQLELDVYIDTEGGRFANPLGPKLVGAPLDPVLSAELAQPGFKVMHVPDVDFHSQCVRFVACLQELRAWSRKHPAHVPILVLINAKDSGASLEGAAPVAKFDEDAFYAPDAEIASVFSAKQLITPDQVRGGYPTLREAVTSASGGWPMLRDARGKVFFALDESPAKVAVYQGRRRSLEGRLMFVNIDESSPAAAYLTLNDPLAEGQRIRAAVSQGFIVRTRADADTLEARKGTTERRDAALASGAQYVSTDYMQPDARFGDYAVKLPDGKGTICNPVRRPDACAGSPIGE